jgi:hypothetical protein
MSTEPNAPPPGWYPDPNDAASTRYWDGSRWTEQRAPVGATIVPPGVVYQPPVVAQRTNGLAIASLVLGILWLWWIGSALALLFGYTALSQIDTSGGTQGGRGLAIAGIVLGWVGAAFFLLFVLVLGTTWP